MRGTRSTVEASALSPRSARPCSMSFWGSASWAMALQGGHSPQKSSGRRSQLAACANILARMNLPTPRVPDVTFREGRSRFWNCREIRQILEPREPARRSVQPCLTFLRYGKQRLYRLQHFRGDVFGHSQGICCGIIALDGGPGPLTREHVVHFGCLG